MSEDKILARRRWLFRVGALVFGLLLAGLLLELTGWVSLRLQQAAVKNPLTAPQVRLRAWVHDGPGIHLQPGQEVTDIDGITYRINNLGFRGGEADTAALRGDTRVIVGIGDSCMYGMGMTEEQTFLRCLQRAWGAADTPSVQNLGVSSMSLEHYLPQWRYARERLGLRPQAVVVMICANDIGWFPATYAEYAFPKRLGVLRVTPVLAAQWWRKHSYFSEGILDRYWRSADFSGTSLAWLQYAPGEQLPARLQRFRAAQVLAMLQEMRRLQDEVEAAGASLAVILLPSQYQVAHAAAHADYQEYARRYAAELGLRNFIEPLAEFRARQAATPMMIDTLHPSAAAHAWLAAETAKLLRQGEGL